MGRSVKPDGCLGGWDDFLLNAVKKKFVFFFIGSALLLVFQPLIFADRPLAPFKSYQDDGMQQFIQFRSRLQKKISPREKSQIQFAIAEYYFQIHAYYDASYAFQEYIQPNPVGVSTFLANIYLYKLARQIHRLTKAEEIKREIFKDKFVLLFDKFKILTYTSLSGNEYEIHFFIDKIEVFLNGELFEEIRP